MLLAEAVTSIPARPRASLNFSPTLKASVATLQFLWFRCVSRMVILEVPMQIRYGRQTILNCYTFMLLCVTGFEIAIVPHKMHKFAPGVLLGLEENMLADCSCKCTSQGLFLVLRPALKSMLIRSRTATDHEGFMTAI
jgi:hypothetical protein